MIKKRVLLILICFFSLLYNSFSQEALKSIEEEYYDFLSLTGVTERPTLGYRTLSDSLWEFNEEEIDNHIWKDNNLGTTFTLWEASTPAENWFARGIKQGLTARIYGPEWFNSYNTAVPYGQNDGALWQGRGYNTAFTAGIRLEGYGFEATFKPQVSWMENREFELMDNSNYYSNPFAYIWGYGNDKGIDAPQRFGDKAFWNYDWGDSEIRWSWHTFTIGFGTQTPWTGPAYINPIIHSNNAPTYPKFDIGIRKTTIYLPYLNWNIGDIEGRLWMGYLSESDFFDIDDSNNHNRINGFSISYSPSFVKGLSIGIEKICLTRWNYFEIKYLNPFYDENTGIGTGIGEDQKVSMYLDYLLPLAGLELYGELGIDDYFQQGWIKGLIRYPFDSSVWSFGIKKTVTFSKVNNIKGEIILEISEMEEPRNKISSKAHYAFNMHHQITQGYTNRGQYLGTFLANGGNAQTCLFNLYYPKGKAELMFQRVNPDNTYSYFTLSNRNETYKGYFVIELQNDYYITKDFMINCGFTFESIINSLYYQKEDNDILETKSIKNFQILLQLKYNL